MIIIRSINSAIVQSFRTSDITERGDIKSLANKAIYEHYVENRRRRLFKMEHSDYIAWIYSQFDKSPNEYFPLEHHVYVTSEFVIEVVSDYEPEVVFLD